MKPSAPTAAAAKSGSARPRARAAPGPSRQALVHELQVHQVELEQQNEELRSAQRDLALAHDRYVDLFDFAPVGYLTLDADGHVTEANLTAAMEFGVERAAVLGRRFQHFVAPADRDRWQRLKARALRSDAPQRIELRLRRHDGGAFHAQVDCLRVQRPAAPAQLRVTIADVSQRQLAETNRRIAVSGNVARESERRRVAYRLHEDLGQRLSGLKIALAGLAKRSGAASLRAAADAMAAQLDEALALVRRMSSDLHPLILDDLGLAAALEWLVGDVARRLGLAVELHIDEEAPLEPAAAIAIYRLAETVLEQLSRQATAGVCLELLQRPHDLVLQFQCEHGHARPHAPAAEPAAASASLLDQVHLLAGRLEDDEPAPGLRRIRIFLPFARPPAGTA